MPGKLDVLNTSSGHLKIVVPDDPTPIEKAQYERVITDMLNRGYLLFVEHKGKQVKVDKYNSKAGEYILVATPEAREVASEINQQSNTPSEAPKKGKSPTVKVKDAKVTGVGPTAGG